MIMPSKITKKDLVQHLIDRRKDVMDNDILEPALLDLLVPMSGGDGKIEAIDEEGNVTVKYTAPIDLYLKCLTKKKLQALLALLDEVAPER